VAILIYIWAPVADTSNDHQVWVALITLAALGQPGIHRGEILLIITKDTLHRAPVAQQVTSPDTEEQMAGPD
jgi:hypothetical protein